MENLERAVKHISCFVFDVTVPFLGIEAGWAETQSRLPQWSQILESFANRVSTTMFGLIVGDGC